MKTPFDLLTIEALFWLDDRTKNPDPLELNGIGVVVHKEIVASLNRKFYKQSDQEDSNENS